LIKSAALELGSYNITVNALIPGLIETPLTRHKERYAQVLEAAGKSAKGLSTAQKEDEARKILTTRTPLGVPWIEPEDVACGGLRRLRRCAHGLKCDLRCHRGR
jgi:NAD(P)-dependent dehydrogenase (short-subunit alcohol dehydrogenase family)